MFDNKDIETIEDFMAWVEGRRSAAPAMERTVDGVLVDDTGEPVGWAPGDLAKRTPGLTTEALLEDIDPASLSAEDKVQYLRACDKAVSYAQARRSEAIRHLHSESTQLFGQHEDAYLSTETELRFALGLSRTSASNELNTALALEDHRSLFHALYEGKVDRVRLNAILRGVAHLDTATAQQVIDEVLAHIDGLADDQSLSAAQIRRRVKQLAISMNPDDAVERTEQALEDRHVQLTATDQSTANLSAYDLPATAAVEAMDRIDTIARSLKTEGETRTMDQLRADVFLGLLRGDEDLQQHARGVVNVHVELETLLGLADQPAIVERYGPVVGGVARNITVEQTDNRYEYVVTHQGQPIATGTTRKPREASDENETAALEIESHGRLTITDAVAPSEIHENQRTATNPQRRQISAADPRCVLAKCSRAASASDFDHIRPWSEGGATTTANMRPICPSDHTIRHRLGLTYIPGSNHALTWTTRLGTTYVQIPEPLFVRKRPP